MIRINQNAKGAIAILLFALPLHAATPQPPSSPPADTKLFQILDALNQVPEDRLTEKAGPALPFLEQLRSEDGPSYATLKTLLGRGEVRKRLNPGVKGLMAERVAPRWDAFVLAGNLWLAALQSANPDISAKARQQLPNFIQSAHIPVLISILKKPGPNVLAFDVLQDVTGEKLDPSPAVWSGWWNKSHGKVDVVGHMLDQSRMRLTQAQMHPFDPNQFWYLPEGVSRADKPYAKRSASEQNAIGRWSEWANADVKRYVDEWEAVKPLFDRIVHQPDARVTAYLESLIVDPGFGDYASVVLAWRGDTNALKILQDAYKQWPTVGRALARGTMGDKTALADLLQTIAAHKAPLAYGIMDDTLRGYALKLPAYGILSAEQAFELLTRQRFGLSTAATPSDKKKALRKTQHWFSDNIDTLTLDPKHGYYVSPTAK